MIPGELVVTRQDFDQALTSLVDHLISSLADTQGDPILRAGVEAGLLMARAELQSCTQMLWDLASEIHQQAHA